MAITSVKFGTSAAGANNATYSPSQNPNIGTELSKKYDGIRLRRRYQSFYWKKKTKLELNEFTFIR